MDPSNPKLPQHGGFNGLEMTDYRPNKSRYVHVFDSSQYRMYLQQNAEKIMQDNLNKVLVNTSFCQNGKHKDPSETINYKEFGQYTCPKCVNCNSMNCKNCKK